MVESFRRALRCKAHVSALPAVPVSRLAVHACAVNRQAFPALPLLSSVFTNSLHRLRCLPCSQIPGRPLQRFGFLALASCTCSFAFGLAPVTCASQSDSTRGCSSTPWCTHAPPRVAAAAMPESSYFVTSLGCLISALSVCSGRLL
jgi:hypothetical protein